MTARYSVVSVDLSTLHIGLRAEDEEGCMMMGEKIGRTLDGLTSDDLAEEECVRCELQWAHATISELMTAGRAWCEELEHRVRHLDGCLDRCIRGLDGAQGERDDVRTQLDAIAEAAGLVDYADGQGPQYGSSTQVIAEIRRMRERIRELEATDSDIIDDLVEQRDAARAGLERVKKELADEKALHTNCLNFADYERAREDFVRVTKERDEARAKLETAGKERSEIREIVVSRDIIAACRALVSQLSEASTELERVKKDLSTTQEALAAERCSYRYKDLYHLYKGRAQKAEAELDRSQAGRGVPDLEKLVRYEVVDNGGGSYQGERILIGDVTADYSHNPVWAAKQVEKIRAAIRAIWPTTPSPLTREAAEKMAAQWYTEVQEATDRWSIERLASLILSVAGIGVSAPTAEQIADFVTSGRKLSMRNGHPMTAIEILSADRDEWKRRAISQPQPAGDVDDETESETVTRLRKDCEELHWEGMQWQRRARTWKALAREQRREWCSRVWHERQVAKAREEERAKAYKDLELLSRWIIDHKRYLIGAKEDHAKDHACKRCMPDGPIVSDTFICAYHLSVDIQAARNTASAEEAGR